MIELIDASKIEGDIKCEDVSEEELEWVIEKGEEMIEYCANNGGAGLAAPQVGIFKNFFVFSPKDELFQIVINPRWFPNGKKTNTIEGCLTYPGQSYYMERYKYINTVFYGRSKETGKLEKVAKKYSKDSAIKFQHEADHLVGKTIATKGKLLDG